MVEMDLPNKSLGDEAQNEARLGARQTRNYAQSDSPHDAQPGTKRLFSNRSSTTILQSIEKDNESEGGLEENESHAGKRYRGDEWPLHPAEDRHHRGQNDVFHGHSTGAHSPLSRGRTTSRGRASKFAEGSMNDRISRMPPESYIGIEGAGDNICEPLSMQLVAKNESSRHSTSSIFRFGKSLAASFNPSNWKIWPRQQDELDAKEKALKDRRDQAEIAYKQIKKDGWIGSGNFTSASPMQYASATQKITESRLPHPQFDECGIDNFRDELTPRHRKRYGKIFLEPPMIPYVDRDESPSSDVQSSRQSQGVQKPSTPSLHTIHGNDTQSSLPGASDTEKTLRRLPSRKELEKQQKLVRRVSDLESKLEVARRQLAEAIGEPMPPHMNRRSRFIPSLLTTLPSESLLAAHMSGHATTKADDTESEIGKAISTDIKSAVEYKSSVMDDPKISKSEVDKSPAAVLNEKPLPLPPSIRDSQMQETSAATSEPSVGKQETFSMDSDKQSLGDLKIPKQRGKKRKSIGMGLADDSGQYKPTPASDDDEDIELIRSSGKQARGKIRKQQKISKEVAKKGPKNTNPLTPSRAKVHKHNSQTRSQIAASSIAVDSNGTPQKSLRSMSPLASMSSPLGNDANAEVDAPGGEAVGDTAVESLETQIPPVPRLPTSVRLASGEIVQVASQMTSNDNKRLKAETSDSMEEKEVEHGIANASGTTGVKSKGSFEWPEDVF